MAATVGVSNLNALRSFSGSGQSQGLAVKEVATQPIEGQKTGTSGLRKKTKASMPAN
jgi:phosphoglucomutase